MCVPGVTDISALSDKFINLGLIIQGAVILSITIAIAMVLVPADNIVTDSHGLLVVARDRSFCVFASPVSIARAGDNAGAGGRGQCHKEQRDWKKLHVDNN
jgi:hypothetical protein